jgi:DNA-binding protein H-NS
MLAPTFEGTLAVQRVVNIPSQLGVRDRIIPNWQMKNYTLDENCSLQSALEELKVQMLTEGATPEAVRLVGEHITITEEEYNIMAEKLKTKTGTPAKKPAAATKGNAPAKEKTGSGRGRVAADFTYKHLMTPKEAAEKVRAGSWTGRMVEIIMSYKTSAAAREALANDAEYGDRRLDFKWAADKGFIAIG